MKTTVTFRQKLLSIQSNLLNFAYTLTLNQDDAYDLLQDTTLKALDNEDKYEPNTNFKGWVFTIMRNMFINNYRRNTRSAVMIDRSEDLYLINTPEITETVLTPDDSYAVSEISDIINSFPDSYRIPFTMHVAGYKYSEIAQRLKLPVGTVKSRIYYARKYLQKALSDYND